MNNDMSMPSTAGVSNAPVLASPGKKKEPVQSNPPPFETVLGKARKDQPGEAQLILIAQAMRLLAPAIEAPSEPAPATETREVGAEPVPGKPVVMSPDVPGLNQVLPQIEPSVKEEAAGVLNPINLKENGKPARIEVKFDATLIPEAVDTQKMQFINALGFDESTRHAAERSGDQVLAPTKDQPGAPEGIKGDGKPPPDAGPTVEMADIKVKQAPLPESHSIEPARLAEARTPQLISQVSDGLETLGKTGQSSLRLQLHPENLGKIDLHLTNSSEGLHVTVNAELPATGVLFERSLPELRQALAQSGVNLAGFTVGYGNSFKHPHNTPQWQPEATRSFKPAAVETSQVESLEAGGSRRQYLFDSKVDYLV